MLLPLCKKDADGNLLCPTVPYAAPRLMADYQPPYHLSGVDAEDVPYQQDPLYKCG